MTKYYFQQKLCSIKLRSKALIDSCISHDEFISINHVLKEDDQIKEKIRYPNENKYV